jgi:hypothetical protein
MKPSDVLYKVSVVIIVILANWVLITEGYNALTLADNTYNWLGIILFIIALLIDVAAFMALWQELKKYD